MNQTVPEDFDWISARAACSVSQVFQRLRMQVEADVAKRNDIRTENEKSKYSFQFIAENGSFSVSLDGRFLEEIEIGVGFRRTSAGIDVYTPSDGQLRFSGEVTLSNDGLCRIKVEKAEYSLWQFRKLSLEGVFFTQVAKWRP
jgi:hypothetical protein